MRYFFSLMVSLLLFASAESVVHASPVVWDLQGIFNDGGLATGSFTYDADLQNFLSWSVTTTQGVLANGSGGPFPGFVYTTADSFGTINRGGCAVAFVANADQSQSICLDPSSLLTDAGGSYSLLPTSEETYASGFRLIDGGTIIDPPAGGGDAIPEPSSLTFVGLGIAESLALWGFRRKSLSLPNSSPAEGNGICHRRVWGPTEVPL